MAISSSPALSLTLESNAGYPVLMGTAAELTAGSAPLSLVRLEPQLKMAVHRVREGLDDLISSSSYLLLRRVSEHSR